MVVLSIMMFAGKAEAQVTVTLMYLMHGDKADDTMSNLIDRFNNEQSNIEVEAASLTPWHARDKLQTECATGAGTFSVVFMPLSESIRYADQGCLEDIEAYVSGDFKEQLLEHVLDKAHYPNKYPYDVDKGPLYAIPIDVDPLVMYYNNKVLEEADLPMGTVPKTWDELREIATKIKESTKKWGFTVDKLEFIWWWFAVYSQFTDSSEFGGYLEDKDGLCTSPECIEKTCGVLSLLYDPQLDIASFSVDFGAARSLFTTNEIGYHFSTTWALPYYLDTLKLEDFGVTYLPTDPYALESEKTWGDSYAFVFPYTGDKERLQAASTFAQWFSHNSLEWVAATGALPVNKNVLNSSEFNALPMRQAYRAAAENAVLLPQSAWEEAKKDDQVPKWLLIRDQLWKITESILQEADTKEELKDKCIGQLGSFFLDIDRKCHH